MDEIAYRRTYRAVNQIACPFEKAVLTRRCQCEKSLRLNIAEREAAGCSSDEAQHECDTLLHLLRRNALFALKLTHVDGMLPHAKEMKVQCGGLLGVQAAVELDAAEEAGVANVFALVSRAIEKFGSLEALPFSDIVKFISAFEFRRRTGR